MARPLKYREEFSRQAKLAAKAGWTEAKIAKLLGITQATLTRYKKRFPEFCASLKAGKVLADDEVEHSLFQRACGYTVPEVKVLADGRKVSILHHYPPNVIACIFWLKNRRPEQWRDRHEIGVTELPPIEVLFNASGPSEQVAAEDVAEAD